MSQVAYHDYLELKKLLNCQNLESEKANKPAHDEMLFIIVHQAYELWFKQVLFEVESIVKIFSQEKIEESQMGLITTRLGRVIEILKLLNTQIKVLETMTPLDFLEFRDLLNPASGFQSLQFRLLEIKLGLPHSQRLQYQNQSYQSRLHSEGQEQVKLAEQGKSLLSLVDAWLARIPFLNVKNFYFIEAYQKAVGHMLERDRQIVQNSRQFSAEVREKELQKLLLVEQSVKTFFDEKEYSKAMQDGARRFSYRGLMAALFINVYRDLPILHMPYRLLTSLMDIDELLTSWRYQHALMVHRMIGKKIGTGGSSGYEYLIKTIEMHKVFTDLFDLSTLFIPRSELPKLPPDLANKMSFQ